MHPLHCGGMHGDIGDESGVMLGTKPNAFSYWSKWNYGHISCMALDYDNWLWAGNILVVVGVQSVETMAEHSNF